MTGGHDTQGIVYLVGAGPGDPALLTIRGQRCLEQADVVVYDYLANPALLAYAPVQAERIYVGRRGRGHYLDQDAISRLLIALAQAGKVVVRLKGGDPFVFGRGGEEAEAVARAGLAFEVVPGVTAAIAAPAYAGIPVTHRTLASAFTVITGHEDSAKGASSVDWPRLAYASGTLVFLMGMKNLPSIVAHLLAEGKSPDTPVAAIRWGTRADQRTVVGTLADIVEKTRAAALEPPTVIVVGEVVRLRDRLNWFESRPLFGKRILVTRAQEQAGELSDRLRAYGADPLEWATIAIAPPDDWRHMDEAVHRLSRYKWLIFTSVNGVGPFMARLRAAGLDSRALAGLKILCIGPRTAEELSQYGLTPDAVPQPYQAEGLLEYFRGIPLQGQRILIPRAAVARELLPEQLRAMGAEVDVVTAYKTVSPAVDAGHLKDMLAQGQVHILTFTSSSTVRNFCALVGGRDALAALARRSVVACIGPVTAQTAVEQGLTPAIVAAHNTIPALVDAIVAACAGPIEVNRAG